MYGKHFAVMYSGSMVGAGFAVFSLMGYVIANMKPDYEIGFQVELNPVILATVFGESQETVQKAIDYLCAPDENTRTQGEEGRRLVKVGTFAYRVVNGIHYDAMRKADNRREQNRMAQAKFRATHPDKSKRKNPNRGAAEAFEKVAVIAHGADDQKAFDSAVTASLPEGCQ